MLLAYKSFHAIFFLQHQRFFPVTLNKNKLTSSPLKMFREAPILQDALEQILR